MAVERVIDLENRRFADREFDGEQPASTAGEEARQADRRRLALARLKIRAAAGDVMLADLLTVLGLDG